MNRALTVALLAAGCTRSEPVAPAKLLDTGWFVDTGRHTGEPECTAAIERSVPRGGERTWYWRDRPVIYTSDADHAAYDAWLVDDAGRRIDSTLAWNVDGVVAELVWDGVLEPSTEYTLWMSDCAGTRSVSFSTSSLGAPLTVTPAELVGTTWRLDLVGATWVEPGVLGGLLAIYFSTPILLGVQYADDSHLDLLGAPGDVTVLGSIVQDPRAPTWDFPVQDFVDHPYFEAEVSSILLEYDDGDADVDIPVQDFRLFATIAPDGSSLGGAKLSGLADTRGMGSLLNADDDPFAICNFAADIGVSCVACADGQLTCLRLEAEDLDGSRLDGLTLRSQ